MPAMDPMSLKTETKAQAYKRSKSVGPVVEAAQRELLTSLAAAREARERSRSRGPIDQPKDLAKDIKRSKSKSRYDQDLLDHEPMPMQAKSNGPYRKESSSLESSRGRSRMKSNLVERSVSSSNKKPVKVDVMDPFLGGNHPRMPPRQKSMIDLRADVNPHWDHHQHLHSRDPRDLMMLQNHHHHQRQHGTPPRHFPHPNHLVDMPHAHPQQSLQPSSSRQGRPPMMRSATEHDIKIRNRRSMAVGPFEDLPPHIRQHMVRQICSLFSVHFVLNDYDFLG